MPTDSPNGSEATVSDEAEAGLDSNQLVDLRRSLPATPKLLDAAEGCGLVDLYGLELVTVQARGLLSDLRSEPVADPGLLQIDTLTKDLALRLAKTRGQPLRRVINATGIFLHTNLGRAPLPRNVVAEMAPLLDASCDLELDLTSGRRSDRNLRVNALLRQLTGAESTLVVNNNAAALVLVLSTFARGREVVVSRGELVEIGGSFRIPDILASAGCELVEVGTTNRTRLADYEAAISDRTALLLKVNPSNYQISGFTEAVTPMALASLAARRGLPLLMDEGSGILRDREEPVFEDHQSVQSLLADGCDLVCGSGDKVLGGGQAGLLFGNKELVDRCRKSPLYRALRPSRLTLVALNGVLDLHARSQPLPLDSLFVDRDQHRRRLEAAIAEWRTRTLDAKVEVPELEIIDGAAYVGGGSAPEREIRGEVLALAVKSTVVADLRTSEPAVLARMSEGRLLLDLRTVSARDDEALLEALWQSVRRQSQGDSEVLTVNENRADL